MPVSFTETISNWPRKAGNHVPYEKGSILCESLCCVPGVPRLWQWNTSPRISVKCRSQEKASILLHSQWRRRALPAPIPGVLLEVKIFRKPSSGFFFSSGNFFFSQVVAFPPERHPNFFHFSVSPKAWSRAEVDRPGSCFSTSHFH